MSGLKLTVELIPDGEIRMQTVAIGLGGTVLIKAHPADDDVELEVVSDAPDMSILHGLLETIVEGMRNGPVEEES